MPSQITGNYIQLVALKHNTKDGDRQSKAGRADEQAEGAIQKKLTTLIVQLFQKRQVIHLLRREAGWKI